MCKTLNLEYSASNICFDPKRLDESDPDRSKIEKAIQLLKRADKHRKDAEKLEAEALTVISPLQLEIMASSSVHFNIPATVELIDKNFDVTMEVEGGQLCLSYSARFSVTVGDDFTQETYEQWEREGGWEFLGLTFAKDGFETADGRASVSWSIDED